MDVNAYLKSRWDTFQARMDELTEKNDRSFGRLMGVVFLIIAVWAYSAGSDNVGPWAVVGALFLLLSVAKPAHLRPLNILWLFIGFVLETLINPLIMGVIYYMVVTPFALVFRLTGRDELHLKKDENAQTYWSKRDFSPKAEDFKKQF